MLKNKISEFHNNGIDSNKIYKLIKQYCSVKSFCDIKTINNADYIDFIKILKIATFLKSKFDNETLQSIMQNTLIYRDNDVCIFRPTTFEESKIIGEPICCFAYNQNGWDEHYIGNEKSIYYVYDVMRCDTSDDFVAITVRPNGRALVLDKYHNWWTKEKSLKFTELSLFILL